MAAETVARSAVAQPSNTERVATEDVDGRSDEVFRRDNGGGGGVVVAS